jgi:hypothetical protein
MVSADQWTTPDENLQQFLQELAELSSRYGLGIAGKPVVFEMEAGSSGDYERCYTVSDTGELEFV